MEQGNPNYQSIAVGERWPPLVRTLISPLVWLLILLAFFYVRQWDYTDVIVAMSLTPFAFYGPISGNKQKWLSVDFIKADPTGLLISYSYFPKFFSKEERVTKTLAWGMFNFAVRETADEGGKSYRVWLEIFEALPSNFQSHAFTEVFNNLDEAQACVEQWRSSR
jgi:hypothetical protein